VLIPGETVGVLCDYFGVTGWFVLVETLAPTAERLSGEVANSISELVVFSEPGLEITAKPPNRLFSRIPLRQRIRVTKPAALSRIHHLHSAAAWTTTGIVLRPVVGTVADSRL